MTRATEILQFWFQGINDQTLIHKNKPPFKNWFIKSARFDEQIRKNFGQDLLKAAGGEYKEWERDAAGRLALVILFDQFSRNIYRNTPKMFAFDGPALALAQRTTVEGFDKNLLRIERTFLYMPFMHAEDIGKQKLSLQLFGGLVDECRREKPENAGYFEYTFDYAQRHHGLIERFGRFPHRNAILGRASTQAEEGFLKTPGLSF